MGTVFGYVSGKKDTPRWIEDISAVMKFGVLKEHLICEEVSPRHQRPQFLQYLEELREGDVLVVPNLKSLGDSLPEVFENWEYLSQKQNVQIVVLDLPMLNTYNPSDVTRPFISKLMLDVFTYVNNYQKENAREWQAQKIADAKARGSRFGRKKLRVDDDDFQEAIADWQAGDITASEAAERLGISRNTFFRRIKAAEESSGGTSYLHNSTRERHPIESFDPEVLERWKCGEISGRQAAKLLHISYTTFQTKTRQAGLFQTFSHGPAPETAGQKAD